MKHLTLPLTPEAIASLRAGDEVLLTGWLYTGRDAAHKRLAACLSAGEPTPFPLEGETIYYVGPAPARPGQVIGPAGPTSSYRMDPYTPALLEHGLKCMIGKGRRSPEVAESIVKNHAVYLLTIGGTAALTAQSIYRKEPVAMMTWAPKPSAAFMCRTSMPSWASTVTAAPLSDRCAYYACRG